MTMAIIVNRANSLESNPRIREIGEPRIFRIPISLVLCSAMKEDKPYKPSAAMIAARTVKYTNRWLMLTSFEYISSYFVCCIKYSNGKSGYKDFHFEAIN